MKAETVIVASLGVAAAIVSLFVFPSRPATVPTALSVTGNGVQAVTLVKRLPVTITAPAGGVAYSWWVSEPSTYTIHGGNALELTDAPVGPLTVTVQYYAPEFQARQVFFFVGRLPAGKEPPPAPSITNLRGAK